MHDTSSTLTQAATSAEAMMALGAALGRILKTGDCVLLYGDLGAGKTTFSRGLIQGFTRTEQDVVSPTFTLVQTYTGADATLYHYDLYRLDVADHDTLTELAWDDSLTYGITLAEWPERLAPESVPKDALHIRITTCPDQSRRLEYASSPKWSGRLAALPNALSRSAL